MVYINGVKLINTNKSKKNKEATKRAIELSKYFLFLPVDIDENELFNYLKKMKKQFDMH